MSRSSSLRFAACRIVQIVVCAFSRRGFPRPSDIATLEAAQERGDYLAIVRLTSGSHAGSLWSAALTAHFGPTGLAILWRDEDDRPSAECLATVPGVAEVMGEARATVRNLIAYWRRELCGTA